MSISKAKNSSNNSAFSASLSAVAFKSLPTKSGYSSLNANIAEGSIPIKGVSSVMISFNKIVFFIAIFFAVLNKPFDKKVLPLTKCFGMMTS